MTDKHLLILPELPSRAPVKALSGVTPEPLVRSPQVVTDRQAMSYKEVR